MKVRLITFGITDVHGEIARGRIKTVITAEMSEDQFLDAILDALESVSGETWEEWKRIIDEDEK